MTSESKIRIIEDPELDLKGKVVLTRVDHNVVKKGIIHDPHRIDATFGTLFNIIAKGGKLILMTHVGRPKDKKTGNITISDETSVKPIVEYLQNKLRIKIGIPEFHNDSGNGYTGIETSVNHLIKDLKNGDIQMIYLPNTRWFQGEEAGGEKALHFAEQLAGLADIFVNDAFGSWQPHASTVLVNKYLPSYAGLLMKKEIENLERIYKPENPLVAVVAGAKFDTKIEPLYALLEKADFLVLGGVIYNAYLCAKYNIEIMGVSKDDLALAKEFADFSKKYPGRLIELPYIIESDTLDGKFDGKYRTHNINELKPGTKLKYILDIDEKSFLDPKVLEVFKNAKTIFVNAVMGFVPHFSEGTKAMDELIDRNTASVKLYGGGDTMQEFKRLLPGLYIVAIDDPQYYIFTGGGAVLKAIQEGKPTGMEPVKVLQK